MSNDLFSSPLLPADKEDKKNASKPAKRLTKGGQGKHTNQDRQKLSKEDKDTIAQGRNTEGLDNEYAAYNNLSNYHKSCLVTSNFWRVATGQPIIPVPPADKQYHTAFNEIVTKAERIYCYKKKP